MKFSDQQIVAVRPFDIICGKKDVKYTHPGNLFYCQVILENRDEYQRTTDRQIKKRIIWSVLGQIKSHGGRFIKVQSSTTPRTVELCDAEAYIKVGQALRMSGMKKTPHTTKQKNPMEESHYINHHHKAFPVAEMSYGNENCMPASGSTFEAYGKNDESHSIYKVHFVNSSSLDELLNVRSNYDYPDDILYHHEIDMRDDFDLMAFLEDFNGKLINWLPSSDDLDA